MVSAILIFAAYGLLFTPPYGRGEDYARFWMHVLFLGIIPTGAVLGAAVGLRWAKSRDRATKR